MSTEPNWVFADAWILTAMAGFGRRGCELSALISVADALNHDIPTEEQLTHSLGRLAASGLASGGGGLRFQVTNAGQELYRLRRGGWFEQAPSILRAMQDRPLTEGRWPLPPGAWQAAYDDYIRRMHRPWWRSWRVSR